MWGWFIIITLYFPHYGASSYVLCVLTSPDDFIFIDNTTVSSENISICT